MDIISDPLKTGFGLFLGRWYEDMTPTTTAMAEYLKRGLDKSIAYAPDRMIDEAQAMVDSWHKNDTDQAATKPPKLPVVLVAIAKDFTPTDRSRGRQVPEHVVGVPGTDDKAVRMKTLKADFRAQLCIAAHDSATARSIAGQFHTFLEVYRGFYAPHSICGKAVQWPVNIESPEAYGSSIPTDSKNLTILAIDLTLQATIPLVAADDVPLVNNASIAGRVSK